MTRILAPLALAASLLATACATPGAESGAPVDREAVAGLGAADAPLAGTSWRLVHFRSGADTTVPPNVERYTLEFNRDGSASLQLDCNRASTRWQARPTAPNAGTLSFAPGAMTRAMCQPGAIDSRIAADLERVRSFTIDASRLRLTLDNTADFYVWARTG